MDERTIEQSVWTEFIGSRQARNVARALKAVGYGTATIEKCRGYVVNVAQYFEPMDVEARHEVLRIIARAAGLQPRLRVGDRVRVVPHTVYQNLERGAVIMPPRERRHSGYHNATVAGLIDEDAGIAVEVDVNGAFDLVREGAVERIGETTPGNWYELAERRVQDTPSLAMHRAFIMADWPEGDEHWEWLATAPIEEIVDWVAAGTRGAGE